MPVWPEGQMKKKGAGGGLVRQFKAKASQIPDLVSATKDLGFYLKSHGKSLTCL